MNFTPIKPEAVDALEAFTRKNPDVFDAAEHPGNLTITLWGLIAYWREQEREREIAEFGHAFDAVCQHCGKAFEDHGVSKNQCPSCDHWAETVFQPITAGKCRHCGRIFGEHRGNYPHNCIEGTKPFKMWDDHKWAKTTFEPA